MKILSFARSSTDRTARRTGGGAAFTLIELLVVIAIIGILAAILLPSLGSAKGMALGASCLGSYIRMMGLAASNYAADNDDYFVASATPVPIVAWQYLLTPYLDPAQKYNLKGAGDAVYDKCKAYIEPDSANGARNAGNSYAAIYDEFTTSQIFTINGKVYEYRYSKKIQQLKKVSMKALFYDCTMAYSSVALRFSKCLVPGALTTPHAGLFTLSITEWVTLRTREVTRGRHNRTFNVMFGDMHAERMKPDKPTAEWHVNRYAGSAMFMPVSACH